ncbi:MAG: CPBP family intramembrane metalloprotease [Calditrichaeota bacterium]|nr:CPBP family intramembrane metalloprotease [Calditrichota bacterium]
MDDWENDPTILPPQQILFIFLITIALVVLAGIVFTVLFNPTIALLSESLIVIPAIIFVAKQKLSFKTVFRFNPVNTSIIIHSILLSLIIFILGDELDRLLSTIFPMPKSMLEGLKNILIFHSPTQAIIIFVAAVIFAGFAEEMFFRGLLQRALEHYRDPALAIVFTSALFASIHLNPWSALQILFLGLALGYMAWKSNSIFPAIILHATNNFLSLILLNSPEEKLTWYATASHVNTLWVFLALLLVIPLFYSFNRACTVK